ncbi:uncharacterized protein LOC103029773 [Astyanax mexicanus]|uniref:uncharacterized protein LOC103029773 n=1 Tax=Astyanax mexicanus TaxID=7994 RepID=UPI0020CAA7E7|nr:uncharacterized protein LOC103029773 [Astyanax mexicanus]
MKILLFFTFYLISGPVSCFDVIGYPGGSVMIYCTMPKNRGYNGYFCKHPGEHCVYMNPDKSPNTWDHKGRVSLQESGRFLIVIYRDLTSKDTGVYQCGETAESRQLIKLEMKTDECCQGSRVGTKTGETVNISCSYPKDFKDKTKYIYKLDGETFTPVIKTSDSHKGRFFISDDKSSGVVRLRISDVIKDDEGVYYCGASGDEGAANYETLFNKIGLLVEGPTQKSTAPAPTAPAASTVPPTAPPAPPPAPTTAPPTALTAPTTPTVTTLSPGSSVKIITVSICVALLLIGGLILIVFIVILKKRRGSTPSARTNQSDHKEVPAVVSKDEETGLTTPTPPKDQEITYSTVSFHKNPGSPTDDSVSVNKEEPETEYSTVKNPK